MMTRCISRRFRASLSRQLAGLDFEPDRLLLSFHGMPKRTLELGDPYHCHCQKTARLVGEALGRPVDIAFQSKFGRAQWLEPATDATLAAYPKQGVKRSAIAAPGFSADCIETLEELGIRGRETVQPRRGRAFRAARLPERICGKVSRCCNVLSAVNLRAGRRINKSTAEHQTWLEWRSSPAARAASAKRSASRLERHGHASCCHVRGQ